MKAKLTDIPIIIASLIVLSFISHFSITGISNANASSVSNDNFQLDIENYDIAPEDFKAPPAPTSEPAQNGNIGVATIPSAFSFSVTEQLIDFGVLAATNPVTRTTTLKVESPGSGYQIIAYENHPLLSQKNNTIPDTTCDNGSCSENLQSLWENNLTYGFGFRCDGIEANPCIDGFEKEKYFQQFGDRGKKELPQIVAQGKTAVKDAQAKLTYRLNISGTQPKEAYSNTVTIIAVPNF